MTSSSSSRKARSTSCAAVGEVARLGPGGFFGELALFDEAPRNASVTAETAVAFAVFTRDNFRLALDEIPPLRDSLIRGMARRLHELDAKA